MLFSWNPSGLFSPSADSAGAASAFGCATGAADCGARDSVLPTAAGVVDPLPFRSQAFRPNQSLSFVPIRKRLASPSMIITKSRMLPPFLPARFAMQDLEKQSHTQPVVFRVAVNELPSFSFV